jgi:hypothetical protein
MSELNHDIDRDNLNKAFAETQTEMARLLFPNGRKRYVEELDEKIRLVGCIDPGTKLDVPHRVFWSNPHDPADFNQGDRQ